METLGERIKLLRGNTTQRQLAEALGIPQTTLANYESNKSELNFRMIEALTSKFRVRTDWLIFGKGPRYLDESAAPAPQAACAHCAELEEELKIERNERRELAAENRQLWRENGELREKVARLEERKRRYELTHGLAEERDVI